ncbi:MAG: adenylosuccinate lyase family protein [Cyclobacteriaceae bacterium]
MASSTLDSDYYKDMFGTAEMRTVFSDENRLVSWLAVEQALAKAQEQLGIIPEGIAEKIQQVTVGDFDIVKMKEEFDRVGFPILPFVKQLTGLMDSESSKWIHYGATTQDVLDTGMVLQIKEGLSLIENDLDGIIVATRRLAENHTETVMPGRTFQQHAAPITLGYKVSVWLDELLRHRERFLELKKRLLVGQCAGAVGTFATLGDQGWSVQKKMFDFLELDQPNITWHTARDRWAELVFWQALVAATLSKIANEVAILMRTEIGELSEPFVAGRGASTTLPQKRNPITCEPIIAIGTKLREIVSSQLTAMIQEHERPVGPMHLEWVILPESFVLFAGSLKHSRFVLENLVVDEMRMAENLKLNGGLIMAEAIMMGLAPKLGKKTAHDVLYQAAAFAIENKVSLEEALNQNSQIDELLTNKELKALINPLNYLGSSQRMIEEVSKACNM